MMSPDEVLHASNLQPCEEITGWNPRISNGKKSYLVFERVTTPGIMEAHLRALSETLCCHTLSCSRRFRGPSIGPHDASFLGTRSGSWNQVSCPQS